MRSYCLSVTYLAVALVCVSSYAKSSGFPAMRYRWKTDDTKVLEMDSIPQVSICWESDASTIVAPNNNVYDFGAIRQTAAEIIRLTWERYSNIKFLWKTTASNSCDVTVSFITGTPHTASLGSDNHALYLDINWMVPIDESSFKPNDAMGWNPMDPSIWYSMSMERRKSLQWDFLRETLVHEFGHILSIAHEQDRFLTQSQRAFLNTGDTPVGKFDTYSIMNYAWEDSKNRQGQPVIMLSCGDVATARYLYDVNPNYSHLAEKCTEKDISSATPQQLQGDAFTAWVNDANINTTHQTDDYSVNGSKVIVSGPINGFPSGPRSYYENVIVDIKPYSTNLPGYNLTFSLKDYNFSGVSCSTPVNLSTVEGDAIELMHSDYPVPIHPSTKLNTTDINLSSCNPSTTLWVPAGMTSYDPTVGYFTFSDCSWHGESVAGYLVERLTFGGYSNGNYYCDDRNGTFDHLALYFNGNLEPAAGVSLPYDAKSAVKFYPLMNGRLRQEQSFISLSSGSAIHYYYVDRFEVTQTSYFLAMGKAPFSFKGDGSRPAETMTWYDAIIYCNNRSAMEGLSPVYSYSSPTFSSIDGACTGMANLLADFTKNGYRLPTEAERDKVYLAGANTAYFWGGSAKPDAPKYAWYGENSSSQTHPVGQKSPNAWGLFDVAGNVREFAWDGHSYDLNQRYNNGGGYGDPETYLTHNGTNTLVVSWGRHDTGFRVMRNAPPPLPFLFGRW